MLAREERAGEVHARSRAPTRPASTPCTGPPPATPANFTTTSRRAVLRDDRVDRRETVASSVTSTSWRARRRRHADDGRPASSSVSRRRRRRAQPRRRAGDQRDLARPIRRIRRMLPLQRVLVTSGVCGEAMKFALFYEIPVPKPWTPGKEHQAYKNTLEQAVLGDRGRLPRVLDRRAPLPRGVLALLEPRGALRRGRRAHREHPHRLRRPAAAEAVQPPDPHRGVGRGARPHLRRPRRLRHRPLVDAPRARGLRHRPRRDARAVAGGARAHRERVDEDEYQADGQVLAHGRAACACSRSRCSSRTRRSSARRRVRGGHEEMGAQGIGLCSFTVGLPPEELADNIALYRKGLAECTQPVGKFLNDTAATFTMVHCAPTKEEAYRGRQGVVRVVPEARRRAHRLGRRVAWRSRQHGARHLPVHTRHAAAQAGRPPRPPRASTTSATRARGVVGDPDACIETLPSATRPRAATCCCAWSTRTTSRTRRSCSRSSCSAST